MTTILDKALKRLVTVDDVDYTVTLDATGLRLTGKGKRKPEVELRWRDLLSGDAAMATALNASLQPRTAAKSVAEKPAAGAKDRAPDKSRR